MFADATPHLYPGTGTSRLQSRLRASSLIFAHVLLAQRENPLLVEPFEHTAPSAPDISSLANDMQPYQEEDVIPAPSGNMFARDNQAYTCSGKPKCRKLKSKKKRRT
jgi:hypothetical protein